MQLQRILKITLLAICVLFLAFQIFGMEFQASGARALLLFLLTILYCVKVKEKRLFFFLFLVLFTLAEIINFSSWFADIDYDTSPDYFYYVANILYIMAYICLIIRVFMDVDFRHVLSKFWVHMLILGTLGVFCVAVVSGTTEKQLSKSEYSLELVYNSIIMVLLVAAMINYISKNSQKSMNLLLGAIFIFFSEVLQMTYFYVSDIHILNVVCSFFLVLAFLFFYLQARMPIDIDTNSLRQDFRPS